MNSLAQEFLKAVAEQKLEFDICNLTSDIENKVKLKDTIINKKDSASLAEIIFGKIVAGETELDVSIKIFLDTTKDQSKEHSDRSVVARTARNVYGMIYEAMLYRFISKHIIDTKMCPNFVNYIGYAQCKLENIENTIGKENYAELLSRFLKGHYKNLVYHRENPICLLLTEKVGSGKMFGVPDGKVTTLNDFIDTHGETEDTVKIMFQIIYALTCMHAYLIMHNDLHSDNVLVCEFPEEIQLTYIIKTTKTNYYFEFSTRYIAYIFDFDWGYCKTLGENPKLSKGDFDQNLYLVEIFTHYYAILNLNC